MTTGSLSKPLAHSRAADARRRHQRPTEAAQPHSRRFARHWLHGALVPLSALRLRPHSRQPRPNAPSPSTSAGSSSATRWLQLGWMLDPLTAVMLVMVTFVGLLIFIYSIGYMARRRKLHPLLLLPRALRRRHARRRHRQQPAAALHVLGDRRPHLLSAHRLLVSPNPRPRRPRKRPSSPPASATSDF